MKGNNVVNYIYKCTSSSAFPRPLLSLTSLGSQACLLVSLVCTNEEKNNEQVWQEWRSSKKKNARELDPARGVNDDDRKNSSSRTKLRAHSTR